MSYWVYVTLSCHNWKRIDFRTALPILFTSVVYRTNVYWSVIHSIKWKSHLSVVWNWYHFVAIAILHQPRPTDSADINTRLQLSDTSSLPPMHGGFLLLLRLPGNTIPWNLSAFAFIELSANPFRHNLGFILQLGTEHNVFMGDADTIIIGVIIQIAFGYGIEYIIEKNVKNQGT